MNANVNLKLAASILSAGIVAGCGGGGAASPQHLTPGAVATASSTSGGAAAQGTTTRLTLTIDRSRKPTRAIHSVARGRSSAAKRTPNYESLSAAGIQIAVTSGSATATLYFDLSNNAVISDCSTDPTTSIETCTLTVPVLGATETFTAIEVDTAPNNVSPSTGQGNAFPSNSHVLAIGTQTITLVPGVANTIPFSLNPVIALLYDQGSGSTVSNYNIAVDTYISQMTPRLVVTANAAGSTFANPAANDAAGSVIFPPLCTTTGTPSCIGQSFVDVNAAPVPVTVTSNSSAFTFYPVPIAQIPGDPTDNPNAPLPLPTAFAQSATIPDSSYLYYILGQAGGILDIIYSGAPLASGTTITLSNGLTATPPTFTGAPAPNVTAQPGPYTSSMTYIVTPISAAPATLTFASTAAAAQIVTGSDVGAYSGMEPGTVSGSAFVQTGLISQCTNSGGTAIANIGVGGYNGASQPFTIAPVAAGTCSFVLFDGDTLVVTNTITVTVN